MTSSAAGRPVLTEEQALELNYLKLTWDRFYDITYDGSTWSAVPKGTGVVLHADSKDQMRTVLMMDAAGRSKRPGRWIERASGPPYFVAIPE
jgi:hypothetical protein